MASRSEVPLNQSRNGSSALAGQEWAHHKKLLRQKYLDEGLTTKEVQQFMLEIHQFSKSIQQYERIFKKWEFKKKLKHKDYEAISHKLIGTNFDMGNTEIMANGKFIPFRDLKSRLSRHITPTLASRWSQNVTQRNPNESSAPSCSRIRSEHDEIVTRQVLAAGRQICYANNLPWFDFLDILAETFFESLTPCNIQVDNRVGNIVLFRTESEAVLPDRFRYVDQANQMLLTTVWKALSATVANDGWVAELQSSNMSPAQLRNTLLHLESQIPRRYPNDYEQSIEIIVDSHMPAAAFSTMSYIFYLISNQSCHRHVTADCANLLLKSNAIPWIKSLAASGVTTAKVVLSKLLAIACSDRNADLLASLVRGDNSIDVNNGNDPSKSRFTARPTLLQGIVFRYFADELSHFRDGEQQKVLLCIDILREAGVDLDTCTCDGYRRPKSCGSAHICWRCSPLQVSMMISKGSKLVRHLLKHGAKVCGCLNITPMVELDVDVEIDVLQQLLEKGVSSRYVRAPSVTNRVFHGHGYRFSYWFPLQAALGQRRSDIAALLLIHNARPDEFSYLEHELTQIYADDNILESSLSRDISRFVKSLLHYNWLSPLTLSLGFDTRMSEQLLELDGAVEDHHYGWLAQKDDWDLIGEVEGHATSQEWLDSSDILAERQDGFQTALAAAVSSGCSRMVMMILGRGATIDSLYSESPLAIAARMGRYDLVRLLLDAGAQVDGIPSLHHFSLQRDRSFDYNDRSIKHVALSPLSEASARNHIEIMIEFINRGANIDHCFGKSGITPLHAAAICGNYQAVSLLLDHGCVAFSHPGTRFCSINAIARLQWFELHQLSEHVSDYDTATDELSTVAITDERYLYGDKAIESSWSKVHNRPTVDAVIQYKLSSTRSPYSVSYSVEIPPIRDFIQMLFLQSLQSNKINIARFLLREGYTTSNETSRWLVEQISCSCSKFTVDASYSWFLLLLDSQNWSLSLDEKLDIVKAMFEKIERHEFEKCLGKSQRRTSHMLFQLKEKARQTLVECLRGCSKQNPQFGNILLLALKAEEFEVVYWLLHHGVKIDHQPDILVIACFQGYGDIVTRLLTFGADVNAQAKLSPLRSATPLDAACASGELSVVKALLSVGAIIIRETTHCTYSALVTACSYGNVDVVKELIAHRVAIDQPARGWRATNPNRGDDKVVALRTPLQAACEEGHLDIVTLLINHNADVNVPAGFYRGITALQAAAINGYFGIVQRLIGAGAKIAAAASRKYGRTAINGAAERGRLDMIKFLLDHYDGDEPMSAVCWKAAGFAKREGHMVLVEFLKSYPGAYADTWQDDYTWSSDSDANSLIECPTDQETSDVDIFEFVHEDMVL